MRQHKEVRIGLQVAYGWHEVLQYKKIDFLVKNRVLKNQKLGMEKVLKKGFFDSLAI